MHNAKQHDRQQVRNHNSSKKYSHSKESETLMYNSGLETNDQNCITNNNGKIEHGENI